MNQLWRKIFNGIIYKHTWYFCLQNNFFNKRKIMKPFKNYDHYSIQWVKKYPLSACTWERELLFTGIVFVDITGKTVSLHWYFSENLKDVSVRSKKVSHLLIKQLYLQKQYMLRDLQRLERNLCCCIACHILSNFLQMFL